MRVKRITIKRIIAGLLAIIAVVAFSQYSKITVKKEVSPTKVAYSVKDIPPHTKITEDMVIEREVPAKAVPPNAVINLEDVVGKWTVEGYGITKNSLFYAEKIIETNEMPDSAILNLKEDEYSFPLLVDIETSSGNSIIPNSYVDLYFASTANGNHQPITGKLFERVRITSVKDSRTNDVFTADDYTQNTQATPNNKVASLYTLAVSEEQLNFLTKAKLLGEIIPVANGQSYMEDAKFDENNIPTKEIRDLLNGNLEE